MSACVTGCTSLGRHMAHCDDEECRGCMPRGTEVGELCGRCWSNLQRDVRTAPSIVDWIREHVSPSSQWGERVNSKEIDAPAPLTVTAVDDADELHAMLASWALLVMEEHPSNLTGPRVTHQRRQADGTVVGLRSSRVATDIPDDRSAPRLGIAPMHPDPPPARQPGERCPVTDLLMGQCACRRHEGIA